MQTRLLMLNLRVIEDVVIVRQRARQIAALLKFDIHGQTRIATSVSEMARNASQYAGGGQVEFSLDAVTPPGRFVMKIVDQGSGINNLAIILAGDYHSETGMGVGIVGVRRIMDHFSIQSDKTGTTVQLEMNLPVISLPLTSQYLTEIINELARYRPNNAVEAIQQQNQELLQALDQINQARNELEQRVQERTLQLTAANQALLEESIERTKAQAWIRQHQQALADVDRINSMGEMASALAHEINQPLASVVTFTKGCVHRLKNGKYQLNEIIDAMQEAASQAERAGQIVHRIKDFAKRGKLIFEKVEINPFIKDILKLMQDNFDAHKITVKINFMENLMTAYIDKLHIERVITNLLCNAIEAMVEAKTEFPHLLLSTQQSNDETIEINIEDNGPGFKEGQLNSIFEPYFTTKAKGLGLGLAICRTIVEAHHGHLSARSNLTGGACFTVKIPTEENKHEQ